MEFLKQYQGLKDSLDQRKIKVNESIAAEKTTQTGYIELAAAKKAEYSNTLDDSLLTQIAALEVQINDSSKKINQLKKILNKMDQDKATYAGDLNQEFKNYISTTGLAAILTDLEEIKADYITALKQLNSCMNDIYNTSSEVKRKANDILSQDQIKTISFNTPIGLGDLKSHIITENKADMLEVNQAFKHLKALSTRI